MSYQIITDSSWDLGDERAKELGVDVIHYYVSLDGETFYKEEKEMPIRTLYEFMHENPDKFPRTSLPGINDYIEMFERHAKQGKDILCCTLSQVFSGSFNTAMLARQMVQEKFPSIRIEIMDTVQATLLQGLIVQELARAQKAGVLLDEVIEIGNKIKHNAKIFFTISNLDYLVHGGRIGKVAALSASILKLCPIVYMYEGELHPGGIVRGRKKSIQKALQLLFDYVKEKGMNPDDYEFMVGYGYDQEEGFRLREMFYEKMKQYWPGVKREISCNQIGATIGIHTGPDPIGCGILQKWTSAISS